jgi:hypothetical protein
MFVSIMMYFIFRSVLGALFSGMVVG